MKALAALEKRENEAAMRRKTLSTWAGEKHRDIAKGPHSYTQDEAGGLQVDPAPTPSVRLFIVKRRIETRRRLTTSRTMRVTRPGTQEMWVGKVPVEVWENVIDQLENDKGELRACAEVCREWTPRSRHHLRKWAVFKRPEQVARLAKMVRTGSWEVESCRTVEIVSSSLRTLGLFATMFAGKTPRLKTLTLTSQMIGNDARWKPGELHVDVFLHLSTFLSITHLHLDEVKFPSVQIFGRLVCALPSLTNLQCQDVWFEAHAISRLGAFLRRPRNLAALSLRMADLASMHDASHFFVATRIASTLKHLSIHWPVSLYEIDQSGIPALVLSAGASLRFLSLTLSIDPLLVGETAPVIDFSKLVNLERVGFTIQTPSHHDEGILAHVIFWICDRLASFPTSSTTLRDFVLRLNLHSHHLITTPVDGAVRLTSNVQHFQSLDDILSGVGLERFVLEIQTYFSKASDAARAHQMAFTRFPKLAAQGVLRVVVIDTLDDSFKEDSSSATAVLEQL